MAGKTIFTNILKKVEARKKAVKKAGGGTPGKRVKVSPIVKPRTGRRKRT
jgi:hypothetical protein